MNYYTLSPLENEPFKMVDSQFEVLINQIESILQKDDNIAKVDIEILKKAWDVAKFYHKNALRWGGVFPVEGQPCKGPGVEGC